MGLLSALNARLFAPELCRVAKTRNVASVIECLSRFSVLVIGADLGKYVALDVDEQELIAIVEAAAQNKRFDGDIHKYLIDGDTFLPVFTDARAAEWFCGAYVDLLKHIHCFRIFRVPGAYVGNWIADGDIIVVNPQSNHEVEINRQDSEAIRAGLPATDDFSEVQFVSVALPMAGISRPIEFSPEK